MAKDLSARNAAIVQQLNNGDSVGQVAGQSKQQSYIAKDAPGGRYSELGISGLKWQWGTIYEEFIPDLNTHAKRARLYNEMAQNDPVISAGLMAIELAVRRVEHRVEGDENDPRVDFISECLDDMAHSWRDHMSEALTMNTYGWSWFEIVYKTRSGPDGTHGASDYTDGKIAWKKLAMRGQSSLYRWIMDENGGINGMEQQAMPDYKIRTIPMEKSILYRTSTIKNNPEGRSLLRSAYPSYYYAKNLRTIEAIGAERDLAGLPMIKMPPNADTGTGSTDFDNAQHIVSRARQDEAAGIVVPDGYEFSLLSSPGSKQFAIGEVIQRYEKRMAMSLLAQFLMLGMDGVGAYSLSQDQSDFFVMAVTTWADMIYSTFSKHAIPRILRLNGMDPTNPPVIDHGPLGTPDLQAISQFFSSLMNAGAIQADIELEKYFREMVSAPEITEEEMQRREEKEAQSEELARRLAANPPQQQQPADDTEDEPQETEEFALIDGNAEKVGWKKNPGDQRLKLVSPRITQADIEQAQKDIAASRGYLKKRGTP